ncbi:Toprim-like [Nocardia farcinica]|uniref:DNA primase n=2 Tax=Nocardia farcinica TaxID=37329 RepID=A0A0H5NXS5_NOCFR|nr:DNA primase [Nocardia farcinica]PFX06066.1 DNA primase [Nocardia farcinica]CRY79844.1 DNA primase [Nocardia farcinica]SIT33582.1 Toprim-like [Nocardia farcinica]
MQRLSASQRQYLQEATRKYANNLPGSPAEEYLESRGLLPDGAPDRRYALGYVADPLPGHETYRGFLSIPYMRKLPDKRLTVVSMRFRCLAPECLQSAEDGGKERHRGHGKYLTVPGGGTRLYNASVLQDPSPDVCVVEGELDAITMCLAGVPTVGAPGSDTWQKHWKAPLLGYRNVFILHDGDDAGKKFAENVSKGLPNGKVIPMPPGEDVNSIFIAQGARALLDRMGL